MESEQSPFDAPETPPSGRPDPIARWATIVLRNLLVLYTLVLMLIVVTGGLSVLGAGRLSWTELGFYGLFAVTTAATMGLTIRWLTPRPAGGWLWAAVSSHAVLGVVMAGSW